MTDTCDSTRPKIDRVITDLERLKMNVASIEARYQILGDNFSNLCSEFLNNIKTSAANPNAEVAIPETDSPASTENTNLAVFATETTVKPIQKKPDVEDMDFQPERISIKQLQDESCLLQIPRMYESSITDILKTYTTNNIPRGDIEQVQTPFPTPKTARTNIVDIMANGIEKGLDAIGNGLIYPFVLISRLFEIIFHKSHK